jgi:hypothetical protein
VVDVTTAVVSDGTTNVLGHGREVADESFNRFRFQRGVTRDRLVEVIDIRLMVPAVVDLHRHLVDGGFQGVGRIGERGNYVCHRFPLIVYCEFQASNNAKAIAVCPASLAQGLLDSRAVETIASWRIEIHDFGL